MSLPHDFVASVSAIPGLDQPEAFLKALEGEVPISIRLNLAKQSSQPDHLKSVPWSEHGYYLDERPSFTADPLFHAGAYYVQEASSMVIGSVVSKLIEQYYADESIHVLDLCGAPGGKSTDIMSQLREDDLLLSNEVVQSRAQILKENVIKWGYPNHLVSQNDPRDFDRLPGFFQIVVVDAPCSGEGMFRKDEDARNEWSLDHVALCGARQERIVADVWDSVVEGGFLIYSTCTFNTRENEQVQEFIQSNFEAEVIDLSTLGVAASGSIKRFFPHQEAGEGFSFFVVRKTSPTTAVRFKSRVGGVKFDTIAIERDGLFVSHQDQILFQTHPETSELLQKNLRLIRSGLQIGSLKKNKLVPSHELAMSIENRDFFPRLELTLEQAQAYLRCETFDLESTSRGYHEVSFRDLPLGYINHLGNRFNNNYPSNWRIRTNRELIYQSIF